MKGIASSANTIFGCRKKIGRPKHLDAQNFFWTSTFLKVFGRPKKELWTSGPQKNFNSAAHNNVTPTGVFTGVDDRPRFSCLLLGAALIHNMRDTKATIEGHLVFQFFV